ncbi:MAG: DDE-type integrase/transposase/recombinase [Candidatus Lokiarchaeota archaeon]|nr:DDE-type integrase/transposase/recombinase [Candidatus Lokiarchaeota archaeon]
MKRSYYHEFVFKVNDREGSFRIPILWPNTSKGCKSDNLKKDGHDTSVKSSPQKYTCKDCRITFYAYTSYFYRNIESNINQYMLNLFEKGRMDKNTVKELLECSDSSVSIILKRIMEAVDESITVKMAWDTPVNGDIIFIDETWITINSKTWYLVVVLGEDRSVLAWVVIKSRTAKTVTRIVLEAISRLPSPPLVIITDDFSTYKRVVKNLNYDLIHVRHIHKPPYNRIIIDIIEHKSKKIITTHLATANDIFCNENTFITRMSTSKERKGKKRKRGRKKGSKNSSKAKKKTKNSHTKKKGKSLDQRILLK